MCQNLNLCHSVVVVLDQQVDLITILETVIEECSIINNLGIMIDEKLNMISDFKFNVIKARRIWRFVKRKSREFICHKKLVLFI